MAEEDGEKVTRIRERLAELQREQQRNLEWLAETIRLLHDDIIRTTGGVLGERPGALLAACARPFSMIDYDLVYPTPFEQAAVLFHGLICGHAFSDGSKRTGTMVASAIIELQDWVDKTTADQILQMEAVALEAALPGGLTVQAIAQRFRLIYPKPAAS